MRAGDEIQNKAVIISAPSGAGKTTIVQHLLQAGLKLEFSVSACSRPKRTHEVHGRDYYFLSLPEFKKKICNGDFLEWQEVYKDSYYGTLKSELERIWNMGRSVIFDVDVFGGINLKRIFQGKAVSIFIMPPSLEILEERLRKRSTETEESLRKRLDKARQELDLQSSFDHIVINDDLELAKQQTYQLVRNFLEE